LHRNSLIYRLNRISEISDVDLDDPETRFALQLALKLHPFFASDPLTA
jgi:purine catabolism regulator